MVGALQCTEGQVPSTEEPVSATGRRGLRGPQMHWCQDPRHTMSCAGLSGTEGNERDRVGKMEPEIETEKWRQRKTERETHRDGDRERWRQRDRDGVRKMEEGLGDGTGDGDREMETEEDREKERQRWRQRERGGDRKIEGEQGDGDRERRRCRETRKTGRERERGCVSRPPGSPSSSLSISTFQPKGAFLTPALTLESQVLHSVSRK